MCACVQVSVAVHGSQKKTLDSTELELQIVVSYLACMIGTKHGPLEGQKPLLTTKPSPDSANLFHCYLATFYILLKSKCKMLLSTKPKNHSERCHILQPVLPVHMHGLGVSQTSRNTPWGTTLLNTQPTFSTEYDSAGLESYSFPGSYGANEN